MYTGKIGRTLTMESSYSISCSLALYLLLQLGYLIKYQSPSTGYALPSSRFERKN